MKKFLLSILCCMLAVFSVQAQEVTLEYSSVVGQGKSGGGAGFETIVAPVNFDFSDACGSSSHIKAYAGCGITLSGATITKVVINATSNTYIRTWSASEGNIAVSGSTATWTGNSTELELTNTATAQARIASIVVTYSVGEGGGETPDPVDVAEPTFTPADGTTFDESLSVTIDAEDGLNVYYSTDNMVSYTEGTSLNITETTTVYAYAEDAEGNQSDVVSATYTKIVPIDPNAVTETIVASETGIANSVAVETLKFGNVTATFDKGSNSNATKYYTSGTAFRAYGGNTITFTGDAGVTINSVVFTFGSSDGSNDITVDCGTYSDGTWTGASNKVVFAIGGTSGNRRLAKITVTYSIEEGAVVIATPSIAGEETFVGSTTVEITNNAEGTTLYYSTNGVDYIAYNAALNISETTTVYAKAVDDLGNESSVAEATFTKLETLTIAEAKAAYDAAGANVDVAMDLTGAVVTVNSGQYMFIENGTTGINIYNSDAKYAVGTQFTSGYILGTSATYRNMHQITGATFHGVATTEVTVEPLEVTIADIAGNYDEYEGRFVKLEGVSIASDLTMTQEGNDYKAYDRFALGFGAIANCDVTGVVAIYNTGEQLYVSEISRNLNVTAAEHATLYLDYSAVIPEGVEAYIVKQSGINEGYITMTQIEGTIPANAGVIIKAQAGDYELVYSTENVADVTGNLLAGSVAEENLEEEAYVLGNVDGVVGLYKAQMTDGVWLNNANKAYLPASAVPNKSAAFYGFDWNGTTGIDEITENREQSTVIYDLTGRRVENITAPGIYIVNGVKRVIR